MKKEYRIKKNEDFQKILRNGQSFANRQLVIYYYEKNDQNHFRVGLSVGKKIGNAVKRNEIKRYLRHAFIELEDSIKPNYDLVIIARKPTSQMSFHEVKKSLTHVLKRSNMFRQ
ncbi:ribonuclease P protein component [Aquisalibacillus elongatus]|uniref:Ribonuclease P protein component n=1 Tax=Aquisalibacillus elongatus TaxID=485577 RepID=A0A3N5B1B2_9BACI|nr:ribonuclease P protein component [Aquisalibacillus elongatus]RPF51134.1 ribonuclease P protein component [Aquisalibacillus elongatus]